MPVDDVPPQPGKTWVWPRPPLSLLVLLWLLLLLAPKSLPPSFAPVTSLLAALFAFCAILAIPSGSSIPWNRARGAYWISGLLLALLVAAHSALPARFSDALKLPAGVLLALAGVTAIALTCAALTDDLRHDPALHSGRNPRKYGTFSLLFFWASIAIGVLLFALDAFFGTGLVKLARPAIAVLQFTSLAAAVYGLISDRTKARSIWAIVLSCLILAAQPRLHGDAGSQLPDGPRSFLPSVSTIRATATHSSSRALPGFALRSPRIGIGADE